MNRLYPYDDPQVLTDDLFVAYGGSTGSSTLLQRELAYTIAEDLVSEHINTPIVPAIITGSYFYPQHGRTIQLDWAYLQRIYEVRFIDSKESTYHTVEGTANVHAAIRNNWRSVVDILTIYGNCQGCGTLFAPYEFEIVYEAGLPSGVYASRKMLWALTEAAQMMINEITGCGGNEAPGLVGITEFRNQEYSEKRTALLNTVFGSSPKAQLIVKLLGGIKKVHEGWVIMPAGLNVCGLIRKISQDTDDVSGGAMITGTVVHENVPARIQQQPEEQLLLQQGLETNKSFTAIIAPVTLDIDERYEFEVTSPTNYYLYGKPLRVVNVRQADFAPSDSRNYIILTLTRSHKAHGIQ